tara:strand:- start:280 stop:1005 length:726 start_codon:yes stop_codon:yes gene_type:complete
VKYSKFTHPFDHYLIDNFLEENTIEKISNQFFDYDSDDWFFYNNVIENKKTLQAWHKFPSEIYKIFQFFCSSEFVNTLKEITGIQNLYPDYGLHGAGMHIHSRGGKLNIHKDYSIHPKLCLQRKLNLILFLSKDWESSWGGALEFWSNSKDNKPLQMEKKIECVYNRAILFDTTQNSWHGLPNEIQCPDNFYRKTLAMYYLTEVDEKCEERYRALFSPTKEQENDVNVIDLIQKRSKVNHA